MYNIWLNDDAGEDEDCDDGGICTGSYLDAIGMACENAKDLVKLKKLDC